jgi:hypothetical protein
MDARLVLDSLAERKFKVVEERGGLFIYDTTRKRRAPPDTLAAQLSLIALALDEDPDLLLNNNNRC